MSPPPTLKWTGSLEQHQLSTSSPYSTKVCVLHVRAVLHTDQLESNRLCARSIVPDAGHNLMQGGGRKLWKTKSPSIHNYIIVLDSNTGFILFCTLLSLSGVMEPHFLVFSVGSIAPGKINRAQTYLTHAVAGAVPHNIVPSQQYIMNLYLSCLENVLICTVKANSYSWLAHTERTAQGPISAHSSIFETVRT